MDYIVCHKDKLHEDEKLELICLNKDCILNQNILNCVVCIEEQHQGHQLISLRKFLQLYKEKEEEFRIQITQLLSTESEQTQYEEQIKKYSDLIVEIDQLKTKMNRYFEDVKKKIHHSKEIFELLNQNIPSQFFIRKCIKENNFQLCQQILKKIFLSISYDAFKKELNVRQSKIFDSDEDTNDLYQNQKNIRMILDNLEQIISQNNLQGFTQTSFSKQVSRQMSPSASQGFLQSNFNLNKLNLAQSQSNFMDVIKEKSVDDLSYSPSPLYSKYQMAHPQFMYMIFKQIQQIRIKLKVRLRGVDRKLLFFGGFHGQWDKDNERQKDGEDGTIIREIADFDKASNIWKRSNERNFDKIKDNCNENGIDQLIQRCNNFNQRFPLAVGLVNYEKAKYYNFTFNGVADHLSGEKYQEHGTYLLNANGMVRSVIKNIDLSGSIPNLRFNSGSELELKFKPFHKQLEILRDDSHETNLELILKDGEKLYFCLRMSDLSDQVEII